MAEPTDPDPHDGIIYEHLWKDSYSNDFIRGPFRRALRESNDFVRHSRPQKQDGAVASIIYHFDSAESMSDDLFGSDLRHPDFDTSSRLEFRGVQQSSAGTVAWFREPSRLYLQTPKDDVGLSYSLMSIKISSSGRLSTVMTSKRPQPHVEELRRHGIPHEWTHTDLPLVVIPLQILQLNVKYTSDVFSDLTQRIEKAENQLMESSEDLNSLIRELNRCNADLLRLERRWNFERKLSATIREVIDEHISRRSSRGSTVENDKDLTRTLDRLMLEDRLSLASEYGISILPRRIQNQFSAAYSLIAQRDTKATISLAEASRRDSSSMKTIAGMTLIFLPPTFICSFFSMSFFNFEATGTKSLWVYAAAAAPLTVVVVLTWIAYNLWSRGDGKEQKSKLDDPESRPESRPDSRPESRPESRSE